jgi:hypothetical protein
MGNNLPRVSGLGKEANNFRDLAFSIGKNIGQNAPQPVQDSSLIDADERLLCAQQQSFHKRILRTDEPRQD